MGINSGFKGLKQCISEAGPTSVLRYKPNNVNPLDQAGLVFYVARKTSAKFGLLLDIVKFKTQNKGLISRLYLKSCAYIYLYIHLYIICNKNNLVIIGNFY